MAKTATATNRIERGMSRGGSRASSARFEIVSIPVYAIMPTGIARKKSPQVGTVPRLTLSTSVLGLKMRTKPRTTSRSCVAKSTTARKMFRPAASRTPTTFSATSREITIAPPMTSHGFSRSGPQKIER
jgi:hypothetical protein